jgi:UDP-glucose 4-epimerase
MDYNMKKILLLGGNGYIGCRLYDHLKSLNYDVTNIDLCWFGKIYEETIVKDYDDLSEDYLNQFTHIILLAAHSSVSMCSNLSSCFENNVSKFVRLIEKIKDNQILLYSSTAAVYGSNPNLVDETHSLSDAINFYDYTKIANETIIKLYPNKNIIGLRFGTVGGISKNFRQENLLNSISASVIKDNKITISNPDNYRSVLGISDLCRAIETLIKTNNIKNKIYNLTTFNAKIVDIGRMLQYKTNCDLVINDSFKTSYSFNCSNVLFCNDYNFTFNDTVDSIFTEIAKDYNNIIVNKKR